MRNKSMGIILIILGAAILAVGIFFCAKSGSNVENHAETKVEGNTQPEVNILTPDRTGSRFDEAKAKGNSFEDYVANLFKDRNIFTVINWYQGVTSSEGVYAESNMNPDFEIEQKFSEDFKVKYWIECKYRSSFNDGKIAIESLQLQRYKEKQGESRQKVLLAIGIGGQPHSPSDFYLVPVDSAVNHELTPEYLAGFKLPGSSENFKGRMESYFREEVFPASKMRKH